MKTRIAIFACFVLCGLFIVTSCNKSNHVTNISSTGGNESHNMGRNCMTCHKSGGEGKGWFNVAGTVYNSTFNNTYPNGTVYLYTGPNGTGTLKYTIQVDAKGNFFTTANIDFSGGLYPAVKGNGATQYMNSSISMGQCNSCHGVSQNKIFAL